MKSRFLIIIGIIGVIVAIVVGLLVSLDNDAKPWVGLDCDQMLDFSATSEHIVMDASMHMEFHQYYMDNCSDTGESMSGRK